MSISTYLAWPHVGGLPGMVFCEANVIEAQNRGDLFIRKRPEHLGPSFLEALEKQALIPPEALSDIASTPNLDIDTSQVLAAEALTETLRAALPDVPMHDIAATGRGALPTFYIRLLPPLSADDTISVNIVSEDLHHFMIVVMVADGSTALQRLRVADEEISTPGDGRECGGATRGQHCAGPPDILALARRWVESKSARSGIGMANLSRSPNLNQKRSAPGKGC